MENNNLINIFYDTSFSMFNLTPREAITLFADIPISEYNLRKFYALSKSLVIFEQDSQQYLQLSKQEFVELVYRVAEHIYKADSYDQDPPGYIMALFDQPMRAKFKEVLKQLLKD